MTLRYILNVFLCAQASINLEHHSLCYMKKDYSKYGAGGTDKFL